MTGTRGTNNNKLANSLPPENRAPVWGPNTLILFQKNTAASIPMTNFVSDPDGDALTITANQAFPQGISYGSNTISYDGVAGANDTSGYTFTASDGDFDIDSPSFRVVIENRTPVWTTIPDYTNTEGVSKSINIAAFVNDPDGDTLSLSLEGSVSVGITFDGTTLTIGANTAVGTYSNLYFTANDGDVAVNSNSFSITQQAAQTSNSPPNWGQLGTQIFTNGTAKTLDMSQFVSDPDGDDVSITPNSALPQGFTFADPILSFNGSGSVADHTGITFIADDGQDTAVSPLMTIRVQSAPTTGISPLPAWVTIDHVNQQIIIAADAPSGNYGPFEFALSGADDQVDPITWDAGAQVDVSPGLTIPYSSILTDDSSHTVIRDVGLDPAFSLAMYDQNWKNDGVSDFVMGFWNPDCWLLNAYSTDDPDNPPPFLQVPPLGEAESELTPGRPLYAYWNMTAPYGYSPASGNDAVAFPRYALKDDFFWIQKIGTTNDAGADNGCTFADTMPGDYPLICHVLDNHFLDPAKRIKTSSVIGQLPAGFSYAPEWGELIYDGTPVGNFDGQFAFRVEDNRGVVRERSFRLRVIVPSLVYAPTGTHWITATETAQQASITRYIRDVKAAAGSTATGLGNTCIFAIHPHDFDFNAQAALVAAEGLVTWSGTEGRLRANKFFRNALTEMTDMIFGSYTGTQIDRTLQSNRFVFGNRKWKDAVEDTVTGNTFPNTGWMGNFSFPQRTPDSTDDQAAGKGYSQRVAFVGMDANLTDTISKHYRSISMSYCDFNIGYPAPLLGGAWQGEAEIGILRTGARGYVCPTHCTFRHFSVHGGGTMDGLTHPMYNHSGEGGRHNYDTCHFYAGAGAGSNVIKSYASEQYFRNCTFSSIKNTSDILDPAEDQYWQNAKEVYGSGQIQDYDGATITLDAADAFDYSAQSGVLYVRILPQADPGTAWRQITDYDPITKVATLGDCEYPSGSTWTPPAPGSDYEVYRVIWYYYGAVLLDQGSGGVTVIENCDFDALDFDCAVGQQLTNQPYGSISVGPKFLANVVQRRAWSGNLYPFYGTKEYMDPQWWDDYTNLHGGATNPGNPYSCKHFFRNCTFTSTTPNHPVFSPAAEGQDAIWLYYTYPSSVLSPYSGQVNSQTNLLWTPMTNPVDADGFFVPGATEAWSTGSGVFHYNLTFNNFTGPNDQSFYSDRSIPTNIGDDTNWDQNYWDIYRQTNLNWPPIPEIGGWNGTEGWWL